MRLSIFTDNNLSKSARDNNDGQYDGHLFCEQDQACSRDGSRSKDSNRKVTSLMTKLGVYHVIEI